MVLDIKKMIGRIGKTSHPFDPLRQQFLSPDQGKIEDDLRLVERAERAGKDNTPDSGVKKKDSLALDIDTHLSTILRKAKKALEDHLHGLADISVYQTNETQSNEVRVVTNAALNSLRETCRNGVNNLFSQKKKTADGERALEKFRKEHGLDRPAVYPENPNRIYGIIFFLFTLEVALNAYTLGSAHPEGPLGVVLETFMISALNIAFGFTLGWFSWREIHHRYASRKFLGLTATTFLLGIIIAGNLAIGHFRDAILSISARAQDLGTVGFIKEMGILGEAVKESLWTHPLELYDFKSYLTTVVGISLALYAAKKGMGADDPYPGYGRISKEQDARVDEYSDLFARLQSDLVGIDKRATQKNTGIGQLAGSSQAAIQHHVGTANRLISAFSDWTEEIGCLGTALYAKYREINEQHSTEPRPPCFDIEYSLPPIEAPGYWEAPASESATDLNALIGECSEKINRALNEYLGVYETIGALAPDDLAKERASSFNVDVERIYREINKGLDDG